MRLYIDPGHGGSDSGACSNGLLEKDVTLDIALRIQTLLTSNENNIQIKMSRISDRFKSLQRRTTEANQWGADYFISIHCNAFNGKARGYEDYIYNHLNNYSRTANCQNIMHQEIIKNNELKDRGQKKANFHVLRETRMPAFLSENGFIDHPDDASLMKQSTWRQKIALAHVNGIIKIFQSMEKPHQNTPPSRKLNKIIVGIYMNQQQANQQKMFLESKGISTLIETINQSGKTKFRLQAGAFRNLDNAKVRIKTLNNFGFRAFIIK